MKRSYALSLCRLFATLIVLEFHIFYLLYDKNLPYIELLSEGKTMLTAMSGFLYSAKVITDIKKFYTKNIKKLLIPAVVAILFMAIFNLVYMLVSKNYNYISLWFDERPADSSIVFIAGNFYYLGYILVCYLITPCLQDLSKKLNKAIVFSVIGIELIASFFFGSPILVISYIAGYLIGKRFFSSYIDPKSKTLKHTFLYCILIAFGVGLYVLSTYLFSDNYFLKNSISLLVNFSKLIFGTFTFFAFILIFKFMNKITSSKFLNLSDKVCYPIYLLNQFFMCGASNINQWVNNFGMQHLIIFPATILLGTLCYFASDFIDRKLFTKKVKIEASD